MLSTEPQRRERKNPEAIKLHHAGLAIVTRQQMQFDDTAWRGPGQAREKRLEKIATEILRKSAEASEGGKQAPPDDALHPETRGAIPAVIGDPIQRVHTPVRNKRELWPTGRERPTWV